MKTLYRIQFHVLLAASLGLTMSNFGQTVTNRAPDGLEQPVVIAANEYRLHPGDTIDVRVHGEDELNCKPKLEEGGVVNLPLLGPVKVGGLTTTQAKQALAQAYDKDYLVNPVVTVTIVEYGKSKISVLGQVRNPGVYLFPSNESLNVLQAIAMAGGYTRIGQPKKIIIKRLENGAEKIIPMNAQAMAEKEDAKIFQVLPGDNITVGETVF